jgi:glutathione S-transferase
LKGLGDPDEAVVKSHLAMLDANLALYDKILSKQKYLAGDQISLPDLYHLPYATMCKENGLTEVLAKYPAVSKWLEGLETRASWIKATGKAYIRLTDVKHTGHSANLN